jgi:hypothetical protein
MKKLLNDVSVVVPDMLDGLAVLNPGSTKRSNLEGNSRGVMVGR